MWLNELIHHRLWSSFTQLSMSLQKVRQAENIFFTWSYIYIVCSHHLSSFMFLFFSLVRTLQAQDLMLLSGEDSSHKSDS